MCLSLHFPSTTFVDERKKSAFHFLFNLLDVYEEFFILYAIITVTENVNGGKMQKNNFIVRSCSIEWLKMTVTSYLKIIIPLLFFQ
jgi:hypothetical protein